MPNSTNLSPLVINCLTATQYKTAKSDGLINSNELYCVPDNVFVNTDKAPQLGEIVNGMEYRCLNTGLSSTPTFTLKKINSTSEIYNAIVIFKNNAKLLPPVITNLTGYPLAYSGKGVSNGDFKPSPLEVYRLSIVFDGFYVNVYVSGYGTEVV